MSSRREVFEKLYGPAPTLDQVRETFERAARFLASCILTADATIEDYPIGRRDRGLCRLQVERVKGKGYRPVKTTTNRQGAWCKPHKGIYRDKLGCIYEDLSEKIGYVWFTDCGLYLQAANGDAEHLVKEPCALKPNRVERYYRTTSRVIDPFAPGGATATAVEVETHVMEADPAEYCDAWELQAKLLAELRLNVRARVWPEA